MVTFQVPPLIDLTDTSSIPEAYINGGWYYGSLELPNPQTLNSESSPPVVQWAASRANLIRSFRTGDRIDRRATISTLTFEVNETKMHEARNFFTTLGAGNYMGYTDHNADQWIAILMDETLEEQLVSTGRYATSTWAYDGTDEFKFKYSFTITIKRWPAAIATDLIGT